MIFSVQLIANALQSRLEKRLKKEGYIYGQFTIAGACYAPAEKAHKDLQSHDCSTLVIAAIMQAAEDEAYRTATIGSSDL